MQNKEIILNTICDYCLGNIDDTKNKIKRGNLYFKMGNGYVLNQKYFIVDENNPNFKEESYGFIKLGLLNGNDIEVVLEKILLCFLQKIVLKHF